MIVRLILVLAILAGIWWLFNNLKRLPPEKRKRAYTKLAIWGVVVLLALAALTGRMHWLALIPAGLLAIARMGAHLLPVANFLRKQKVFGDPVFRTDHIEARVNLQSGDITGKVIRGPHEGKALEELSVAELQELRDHYKDRDKRAYFLLFALLQRRGAGSDSRDQNRDYSHLGAPDIDEAKQILGLTDPFDKQAVKTAHKRLMQKLHPDRGGNDYLASRVNAAKETLLRHLENGG